MFPWYREQMTDGYEYLNIIIPEHYTPDYLKKKLSQILVLHGELWMSM